MSKVGTMVGNFRSKDKLILTLLVKNEADIILDNIFFHYARGVDSIIVTDNGSTDGTLDILKRLQEDKLVHVLQEEFYHQDTLVNKMGKLAKETYGATMLIHADADEFWNPVLAKDLKQAFIASGESAVLVERKDILPTPECRAEVFPQAHMNMITKHLQSDDVRRDSQKISLFAFLLPPKVMFSVKDNFKEVGFGNHNLAVAPSDKVTQDIVIFHFPFKSEKRFIEKVIIGGEAYNKIETSAETGWHWKQWYKDYKSKKLERDLDILIPDLASINGVEFRPFDYQVSVQSVIRKNRGLWRRYQKHKAAAESQ